MHEIVVSLATLVCFRRECFKEDLKNTISSPGNIYEPFKETSGESFYVLLLVSLLFSPPKTSKFSCQSATPPHLALEPIVAYPGADNFASCQQVKPVELHVDAVVGSKGHKDPF